MAKLKICSEDVKREIKNLQIYRSGWANSIGEGGDFRAAEADEILVTLVQTADDLIVALQSVLDGQYRDKMHLMLVKERLENMIQSETFKGYARLGSIGFSSVVTRGTCQHIRCMLDDLKVLTR